MSQGGKCCRTTEQKKRHIADESNNFFMKQYRFEEIFSFVGSFSAFLTSSNLIFSSSFILCLRKHWRFPAFLVKSPFDRYRFPPSKVFLLPLKNDFSIKGKEKFCPCFHSENIVRKSICLTCGKSRSPVRCL